MSKIVKQDTNGVKPLLAVGELGYDNYPSGGDIGRVYVGTGSSNIAQAKKSEVVTVDGKVDAHIARADNPHSVTKTQVGLGNVDNTSDVNKPISTATQTALDAKQATLVSGTNIKTIEGQSIVGSGNIDLSKNDVGLSNVDNTADTAKVVASAGKWTTARLINGSSVDGASDVTTSKWGTSRSITIGSTAKSVDGSSNITWTLGEIGAIGTDSPAFTGTPTATTAAVGTNTTQLATTAFVNAEIANDAIPRITSIDTAIPKFNGTTGNIQSSGIRIDSNDGIVIPKVGGGSTTVTVANGASNTDLVLPESGTVSSVSGVVTDNAIARYDGDTGKLQNSSAIVDDNGILKTLGSIQAGSASGSNSFTYVQQQTVQSVYPVFQSIVNGVVTAQIQGDGGVLCKSTGGIGYGTGSGGTVTQLVSKGTAVTLSKPTGLITMNNSALAAGANVSFPLNNSLITANDIVVVTVLDDFAGALYRAFAIHTYDSYCILNITNMAASSRSDAVRIAFAIIKGATA